MADEDIEVTDVDLSRVVRQEDIDRYDRRRRVLYLRGRRMSVPKIASALNITERIVRQDLTWIREQGAKAFGSHPEFDPHAFIWESLCRFEDIESTALRDSMSEGIAIRDKMICLNEAREARKSMIELLMDTGQLQRVPVSVNVNLPSAAQIRSVVTAAMNDDDNVIDLIKKRPSALPPPSGNGHGNGNGQAD